MNSEINILALAYLGDAVYELFIRRKVVSKIKSGHADLMHKEGIRYVCAGAQSFAVKKLIEINFFSEEELAFLRRARNHRISTKAKNASPMDYKWATAFEALIGYCEYSGLTDRLTEIMNKAAEVLDEHTEKA